MSAFALLQSTEVSVLSAYMPQQLSEQEVAAAVDTAIAQTGAKGPAEAALPVSTSAAIRAKAK